MPEMNRRPDEPLLFNWLIGGFTNSGLDQVLRLNHVRTIVLMGFAQQAVVCSRRSRVGICGIPQLFPRMPRIPLSPDLFMTQENSIK